MTILFLPAGSVFSIYGLPPQFLIDLRRKIKFFGHRNPPGLVNLITLFFYRLRTIFIAIFADECRIHQSPPHNKGLVIDIVMVSLISLKLSILIGFLENTCQALDCVCILPPNIQKMSHKNDFDPLQGLLQRPFAN